MPLKKLCFFLILIAAMGCTPCQEKQDPEVLKEQIRALLEKHPEIVLQVLRENKVKLFDIVLAGNRAKEKLEFIKRVKAALKDPLQPEIDPQRPLLGNPQAPVTIVEYSDFLCPACMQGAGNVKKLSEKHPKKIRVLLKHLPSDELSHRIAVYSEAIGRQGVDKAWQFQDEVFRRQDDVADNKEPVLHQIASKLGVDQVRLSRDLADKSLEARIKRDEEEARRFELNSTPSYIVNGVPVHGAAPVEALENVIRIWENTRRAAKK